MAYRFAIDFPGPPAPEVLAALVEAAARSNALWYLEQWRVGLDPPCCASCAGILWRPDAKDVQSLCVALPRVLDVRVASCHSIAAMSVGHERAANVRDGAPWDVANELHRVELHETGERVWHALMRSNGELKDVAAKCEKG